MMGRQTGEQAALFYSFNLDQHIPSNHLLRDIDRVLDLSDLHQYLAPYYSQTGRPSIDPALMIRMLLIGYCFGIRSERRLCEEGLWCKLIADAKKGLLFACFIAPIALHPKPHAHWSL